MTSVHGNRFSNESDAYRQARDRLLLEETALRRQIESVAAARRALPRGGLVSEYEFQGASGSDFGRNVKLSDLFRDGKSSLIIYNFMYAPDAEHPCPFCVSLLDGLERQVSYIKDQANFAVVAKAPPEQIRTFANSRDWRTMDLLSSFENTYNHDYFGEDADGGQWPMANVFIKTDDGVFHHWGSELLFVAAEPGQEPRHVDMIWPRWNLADMTPEGRDAG